jgi:hypothetical protein
MLRLFLLCEINPLSAEERDPLRVQERLHPAWGTWWEMFEGGLCDVPPGASKHNTQTVPGL